MILLRRIWFWTGNYQSGKINNLSENIRLVAKILFPVSYTRTYLSKPETSKAKTTTLYTAHYYFRIIYKNIAVPQTSSKFPLIRAFCLSVCKFNDKTRRAEQRVFVFAEEELAIAMAIMWSAVRYSRPGSPILTPRTRFEYFSKTLLYI